jgi:isoamylase
VQHTFHERALVERGLVNYWGYNPIGFFAPDARFRGSDTPGDQVRELKTAVRTLHRAGIEVILDVVFNHTGEADPSEPTLCLRGLGNDSYYRLDPHDRARYVDVTGCGNTLELRHPQTLRLIADCLRYWVEQVHVDGFRFDLASALCRSEHGVEPWQGLFALLMQDPVLRQVKLIAEPWDAAPDGMRLGGFPSGVVEWNAYYRDDVRAFWRGEPGKLGALATRLAGSSDLFARERRGPHAGVSYVTCHDGLTLADLTHGWAPDRLSDRIARGLITTLAFSLGVPMLSQGDELTRSQGGHDNAYALDDETSWVDWSFDPRATQMLAYVTRCLALRRQHGWPRRGAHFAAPGGAGTAEAGALEQVR